MTFALSAGLSLVASSTAVAQPNVIATQEQAYEGPSVEVAQLQTEVKALRNKIEDLEKQIQQLKRILDQLGPLDATPSQDTSEARRRTHAWIAPTTIRTIRRFDGHTGSVRAVAISPDGRIGASTGDDGTVRLWDLATFTNHSVLVPPQGSSRQLLTLAFSPDGKTLAAGGHNLYLFKVADGELLRECTHPGGWVDALTFSPNGKLASVGRGVVRIWDIDTGSEIASTPHGMDTARSIELTSDEMVLCAGGYANNSATAVEHFVRMWDVETGIETFRLDYPVRTTFRDAVLIAKGTRILTAGPSGDLREWEIETGKEVRVWKEHGDAVDLAVAADDRFVAVGCHHVVELWDAETARKVDSQSLPDDTVRSVSLSADARRVIFANSRDRAVRSLTFNVPAKPIEARVLEEPAADIKPERRLLGHSGYIYSIAVSPDGKRIASGGFDGSLRCWELESGREVASAQRVAIVNDLAYTPDGKRLLLACGQTRGTGRFKIWDVENWQEIMDVSGHDHAVTCIAVDPLGEWGITGSSDTTIKLWNLETGAEIRTLKGHTNSVSDVAISSDRHLIASASSDGSVRLWKSHSGRQIWEIRGGFQSVDFSLDSQELLVASQGEVSLRSLEDGSVIRRLAKRDSVIQNAIHSPQKDRFLTGSTEAVRLFDRKTYRELMRIPTIGYPSGRELAFVPDGSRFITVGHSNSLEVWLISNELEGDEASLNEVEPSHSRRSPLVAPRP